MPFSRKSIFSFFSLLTLCCATTLAAKQTSSSAPFVEKKLEGYYIGVYGGSLSPNKFGTSLKTGYSVGGHYGYRDDNYRTEFTFNYLSNNIKQTAGATYYAINLMLNAYYDFNFSGVVVPFVGVGIGYLSALRNGCTANDATCSVLQTGNKFSYQGIAGIGFNIKDKVRIDFRYRYLALDHSQNFSQNIVEAVINFFLPK